MQGTAGVDSRTSPGYARRGGFYGVTAHDFADTDDAYSFTQMDYEAIQHIPILRDAWVLSLHARVETTYIGDDERDSVLHAAGARRRLDAARLLRAGASATGTACCWQAEWRVLANRFLDMAIFFDAGKVTAQRRRPHDFDDLKKDYGLGFRLHGPLATPLRIELAKSNEGLALVFSSKASF